MRHVNEVAGTGNRDVNEAAQTEIRDVNGTPRTATRDASRNFQEQGVEILAGIP